MAMTGGERAGARPSLRLSILVPVYDVLPFVAECLASILRQIEGRPDIELIVLDDKSTDGSAEVCRKVLAGSPANARLLGHEVNRGLSAARNSMLEVALGEYVWFVDSDDRMLPGAVAALLAIVETSAPDVILCDYTRDGGEGYRTFRGPARSLSRSTEALVAGTFAERRLHAWSKVWKRDLFGDTIRFPEGACFEDVATVPWLLLEAKTFYYAAEPWIDYRPRPGSIMALVNNTRAPFDRRRQDDCAHALDGFKEALAARFPDAAPATRQAVARFVAREFVKIAKRLARGIGRHVSVTDARAEIARYRQVMEAACPGSFREVAAEYWRGKQFVRAAALWLALAAGR